jgi:hypothetical protein
VKTRLAAALLIAGVSLTALTGCFSVTPGGPTISPDQVASAAEDALEAQVGSRPEMDCGTSDIALEEGAVVDCVLTDPATGDEYDATVTLSQIEIDGDQADYHVSVQVADQPRG